MTNDYHLDEDKKLRINHEKSSLQSFDDGHIPETFRHGMSNDDHENQQPRIVIHHHQHHPHDANNPSLSSSSSSEQPQTPPPPQKNIAVFSNALPTDLTDSIYNTSHNLPSWGDYVTMDEAKNYHHSSPSSSSSSPQDHRHDLSIAAVSALFLSKGGGLSLISPHLSDIHGVAVWVLSSSETNEVRYHVDYAELVRYEHNVIYPPLYAGTVQCSKVNNGGEEEERRMEGGDFAVNVYGWDHYERHGYKGVKSGDDRGGYEEDNAPFFNDVSIPSSTDIRYLSSSDLSSSGGWITIPYRYNQACLHIGHYPHLSTKITKLPPGYQRVIMGFNAFDHCVGPLVQKAPEHSALFNRKVKLYQALARTSLKATTTTGVTSMKNTSGSANDDNDDGETLTEMSSSMGDTRRISPSRDDDDDDDAGSDDCRGSSCRRNGIDVNFVKRHKALTKLLVLAKREKVKEHLKQETKQLTQRLLNMFDNENENDYNTTTTPVTTATTTTTTCGSSSSPSSYSVQYLMTTLSGNEGMTPRPVDVQVCVNQLIRKGVLICCAGGDEESRFDDCGFVLPTAVVTKTMTMTDEMDGR